MGHAQGMDAICSDPTCDRKHYARGFCRTHYMRVWRHGDINRGRSSRQPCSWKDGCRELSDAKGLCHKHYEEQRRRARGAKVRAPRGSFTPCSKGDGEPVVGDGLCRKHYMRKLRKGTTDDERKNARGACSRKGCGEPHTASGLCRAHWWEEIGGPREAARKAAAIRSRESRGCAYCGKPLAPEQRRHGERSFCPGGECKAAERAESGAMALAARKSYFKTRYGLTVEEVETLVRDGRCAICGTQEWMGRRNKPHIDHDHTKPGTYRGLLCHNCNLMIGYAHEDPTVLQAAIRYLSR